MAEVPSPRGEPQVGRKEIQLGGSPAPLEPTRRAGWLLILFGFVLLFILLLLVFL